MRTVYLSAFALVLASFVAGCASGPKYSKVADSLPPIPSGKARIYFYRDASPVGSAVQSPIVLGGEQVGKSVPGSFFFVDVAPGDHEVSSRTETEKKLSFTVDAGQTRYVRSRVSLGAFIGHIGLFLEDEETAMKTMKGASYIGDLSLEKE